MAPECLNKSKQPKKKIHIADGAADGKGPPKDEHVQAPTKTGAAWWIWFWTTIYPNKTTVASGRPQILLWLKL